MGIGGDGIEAEGGGGGTLLLAAELKSEVDLVATIEIGLDEIDLDGVGVGVEVGEVAVAVGDVTFEGITLGSKRDSKFDLSTFAWNAR